jgi:hypothetical protein
LQWTRRTANTFAPNTERGSHRDELNVSYGGPVRVFAERHRLADGQLGAAGHSAVGVSSVVDIAAMPLIGLPDGRIDFGLGCRVENQDGWADEACRTVDDFGGWTSVRWSL